MFDVGFTEILLIGIVSLVVIGPERLPAVAKTAGRWIGKLQRFVKGVKTDLASELETGDLKKLIGDQREQINELRDMVSTAKKDFQSTTQNVVKNTREGLKELETSVNQAKEEAARVGEEANKDIDEDIDDKTLSDNVDTMADAKNDAIDKAPAQSTDSGSTKRTGTTDSEGP